MDFINAVGDAIFGTPMLALLMLSGVLFTLKTGFFQIRQMPLIIKKTALSLFSSDSRTHSSQRISKLQSVSASLAATVGTGSVVGVASAIAIGGRGAVFWMWISALLGMMTAYAEGVLSVKYSRRSKTGAAMSYIKRGLGSGAAFVYAVLSTLAAFGMGNMAQVSCISGAVQSNFGIPPAYTALAVAIIVLACSLGGMRRIASATQILLPVTALLYIIGCAVVLVRCSENILPAFSDIICQAFGIRAAVGGAVGSGVKAAISVGFRRGVFSNEAGLGTTAAVHASSETDISVEQGMWNIFEVFADTILLCTLSALVIMVSNADKAMLAAEETVSLAFCAGFGRLGGLFSAFAVILFALATVLGWSAIGERSFLYIFPSCPKIIYPILFSLTAFVGGVISSEVAFSLSDIFNGLMAVPNLAALLVLAHEVKAETNSYLRQIKQR